MKRRAMLVSLLLVLVLSPAWGGGVDEPGMGNNGESTTIGVEAPTPDEGWAPLDWVVIFTRLAVASLAL